MKTGTECLKILLFKKNMHYILYWQLYLRFVYLLYHFNMTVEFGLRLGCSDRFFLIKRDVFTRFKFYFIQVITLRHAGVHEKGQLSKYFRSI